MHEGKGGLEAAKVVVELSGTVKLLTSSSSFWFSKVVSSSGLCWFCASDDDYCVVAECVASDCLLCSYFMDARRWVVSTPQVNATSNNYKL